MINKLFSTVLLLSVFSPLYNGYASYAPLSPTLGVDSAHELQEISESDYNNASGSSVFIDYESTNSGLIPHHYSYQMKSSATSSLRLNSEFSGQNITASFFNLTTINYGSAIYLVSGNVGNITGDFINNTINSSNIYFAGGAIYNSGRSIKDISGDFIGNKISGNSDGYGGAIDNYDGTIININGNFINNSSTSVTRISSAGAIMNESHGTINEITGTFIKNYAITSATSNPFSNIIHSAGGGAISNIKNGGTQNPMINKISADFNNNFVRSNFDAAGGAIYNRDGTIGSISGNFLGNYVQTNHATQLAYGGAIWSNRSLTFLANAKNTTFQGNYTLDSRGKIYNAIYLSGTGLSLNFNTAHNGNFIFHDNIDASDPYNINITGDNSGRVIFKNQIINANNINVSNTIFQFGRGSYEQGSFNNSPNLNLTNAVFNLNNGYFENINLTNYNSMGKLCTFRCES